jgi:hypothetical protein
MHESHLEHTPHVLGCSWSSENLWFITLGDRHHLNDLVVIGAQLSPQRICWWPDSMAVRDREGSTTAERQRIIS